MLLFRAWKRSGATHRTIYLVISATYSRSIVYLANATRLNKYKRACSNPGSAYTKRWIALWTSQLRYRDDYSESLLIDSHSIDGS